MPYDADLEGAHNHCTNNEEELSRSVLCGCFYCLVTYPATQVTEFVDEIPGRRTALCPKYDIDSVIGDASGVELTTEFLRKMKNYWF